MRKVSNSVVEKRTEDVPTAMLGEFKSEKVESEDKQSMETLSGHLPGNVDRISDQFKRNIAVKKVPSLEGSAESKDTNQEHGREELRKINPVETSQTKLIKRLQRMGLSEESESGDQQSSTEENDVVECVVETQSFPMKIIKDSIQEIQKVSNNEGPEMISRGPIGGNPVAFSPPTIYGDNTYRTTLTRQTSKRRVDDYWQGAQLSPGERYTDFGSDFYSPKENDFYLVDDGFHCVRPIKYQKVMNPAVEIEVSLEDAFELYDPSFSVSPISLQELDVILGPQDTSNVFGIDTINCPPLPQSAPASSGRVGNFFPVASTALPIKTQKQKDSSGTMAVFGSLPVTEYSPSLAKNPGKGVTSSDFPEFVQFSMHSSPMSNKEFIQLPDTGLESKMWATHGVQPTYPVSYSNTLPKEPLMSPSAVPTTYLQHPVPYTSDYFLNGDPRSLVSKPIQSSTLQRLPQTTGHCQRGAVSSVSSSQEVSCI